MIVEPFVGTYQTALTCYLLADSDLEREGALLVADDMAHELLAQQASIDDLLALHARAKVRLTAAWSDAPAGSPEHHALRRMARGDGMALMLALMLPQQVQEQRQAERRWQAEHDKLATVFEQTDDLVLMFDAAGTVEYLNPAFTRATGWTLQAAQQHGAQVWALPLGGGPTRHVEAEQARADGSRFSAAWAIWPVRDAEQRLLNHVCIGRDVTRQRQMDEALRQNDRLRAVSTLAAGVAHDFNNLLGAIQGLTGLCQLQAPPGSALATHLDGIQHASQRAAHLVGQLLSFAREQPTVKRALVLADWLPRLTPLLAATLPRGVQLRLHAEPGLQVDADPGQIEQVLLNLVKNAGHAMRARGGAVELLADRWAGDDGRADWVRVRVVDSGEGIAPELLPRIFEPFFTTKPAGEGTGLGLAAAFGIVRQHQGELRADSAPGVRTVFTLLLPGRPRADAAA